VLASSLATQCATPTNRRLEPRAESPASNEFAAEPDAQREWLGRYGGLELQPHARFVADRSESCIGPFVHSVGTVVDHGDRIELVVDNGRPMPDTLLRVRWGERHYLVASQDVQDFCNAVNAGFEPCGESSSCALLRSGDEKRVASGKPESPPEYSTLLLATPVEATVNTVGPTEQRPWRHGIDRWHTLVTLDFGSDRGAWLGMQLWFPEHPSAEYLKVVELDTHGSRAEYVEWQPDRPPPEVGWLVSTSARVHGSD
jgi:hypothetical protein